jgi:hypothetical protein
MQEKAGLVRFVIIRLFDAGGDVMLTSGDACNKRSRTHAKANNFGRVLIRLFDVGK